MASLFGALGSLAESYGLARQQQQENALAQLKQQLEQRYVDMAGQRLNLEREEQQRMGQQFQQSQKLAQEEFGERQKEFEWRQKEAQIQQQRDEHTLQDLGLPVSYDPNTGEATKWMYRTFKGDMVPMRVPGTGVTGKDSQQYIDDVSQNDPDFRRYLTTEGRRLSEENHGDQTKVLEGLGKIAGEYMKEKRAAAAKGKKTPAQIATAMAGLRSLRVNLTGGGGIEGLGDTLGVLDSWWSRKKMIMAGVGEIASSARAGVVSEALGKFNRLMESTAYDTMSDAEKAYIRQFKFAISTVSALRPFSQAGSRSLQAMKAFTDDLPDPVSTPTSDEGRRKIGLLIRDLDTIERTLNEEMATTGGTAAAPMTPGATPNLLTPDALGSIFGR